jgi:DDE family transposase
MTEDRILPFSFPAVHAKKVTGAFDGSRLTSNGGVTLLATAERRLGLADNLARVFPDRRDPTRVVHTRRACRRIKRQPCRSGDSVSQLRETIEGLATAKFDAGTFARGSILRIFAKDIPKAMRRDDFSLSR